MKVSQAITNFMDFQKMNSRKNMVKNYSLFLNKFKVRFNNQEIESITSDETLWFFIEKGLGSGLHSSHNLMESEE